ncbi:MAG: ABC transporter ATP-binding protein [Actinobacteria bacterium]|nr:ABC transporter ATP-binding protein [Actinomycetota bacterium]MCL5408861.1 ABC transporter ATP-binding protein [Candidatus Omnitrophota bacterium]
MKEKNIVVKLTDITKIYKIDTVEVLALSNINLEIEKGEFVAIMGPSGSGKSTLLSILGCLDGPTSGTYYLESKDVSLFSDDELSEIRCHKIGFIFQAYNLISQFSVLENIEVPLFYSNEFIPESKLLQMAQIVGLGQRIYHRPNQLSGGEQQRVAIARSMVNNPAIILADEPTGNLDSKTGIEILNIFTDLHQKNNTIIMVTHSEEVAKCATRIIRLKDGKII